MSRKRNVTVAAVQMKCSTDVEENIAKADALVREAAEKGAQIILLPELFERQYFCQERRYEYYEFAKEVNENDAVKHFSALAKELSVVIPVSFYEKDVNRLFNTVAVINADGSNLGIYRKTHIPEDGRISFGCYVRPSIFVVCRFQGIRNEIRFLASFNRQKAFCIKSCRGNH